MTKLSSKFLVIAIFAGLAIPTLAPAAKTTDADFQLQTAQNLYNLCTTSNDNPARERAVYLCVGYIEGALDLYQTLVRIGRLTPKTCLPATATRIQVARVFIAWGEANPKRLSQAAMDGLGEATQAKWPCAETSRN